MFSPQPKPTRTRKQEKASAAREEVKVKRAVRVLVVRRDVVCRGPGPHAGRLEWAHLEDHRRTRTTSQAPELRHTLKDTAMLCDGCHDRYDAHRLKLAFGSELHRADGMMYWTNVDTGEFLGSTGPTNPHYLLGEANGPTQGMPGAGPTVAS